MAWAHLKTNQAARDYRFQVTLTASAPSVSPALPIVSFTARMTVMTGNDYPDSGLRVEIVNVDNNPEPGNFSYVNLEYPNIGWSYTETPATSWRTPCVARVELDQCVLTESCDPWAFDFDDGRLYIDGVLADTKAGPNSDSGTNFDHRYNVTQIRAFCGFGGFPGTAAYRPHLPDCGDSYHEWAVSGNASGGWQHDPGSGFISENTIIESTYPLPSILPVSGCPTCDCSSALPSVSGTTSYAMTVTAIADYLQKVSTVGTYDCKCWDGTPAGTLILERADVSYLERSALVDVFTKDDGVLYGHTKEATSCCGCQVGADDRDCNTTYAQTNESVIYCRTLQRTFNWTGYRPCYEGFLICPDPPEGVNQVNCAGELTSRMCIYRATREIGHTPYSCTACVGKSHLTSVKTGMYYAVIVESGGNMCVWRFDFHEESFYTSSPVDTNVDNAQIACHPNGTVLIVYQKSGQTYWKASTDMGETWTAGAQIGTGFTKPAITVDQRTGNQYVAAWSGSAWRLWVRKGNPSGSWTNTASISASNADLVTMEWTDWGNHKLAFCRTLSSGEVSIAYSSDNGTTWSSFETVVASGATNGVLAEDTKTGFLAVALHNGTEWRYYKKKAEASSWANTGSLSSAASIQAGFEFGYESPHRTVLIVEDSAVMKRFQTTDLGSTAAEG